VLTVAPAETLLLILPADAGGDNHVSCTTPVAGMPLVRRIALAAMRAGFGRIVVHELPVDGALSGIRAQPLRTAEAGEPGVPRRLILLPANVVPQPDWLRALRTAPVERDTLYVDGSMAMLIETGNADRVLASASGSQSARDVLGVLRARFPERPWPVHRDGRFPLAGRGDVARAETWLLKSLIKSSEGFMSRHVERRVSLALTRRLVGTGITPNAMTAVSVGIGLLGAPCFLSAEPLVQLTGALLFLTHSILDGCDGELARLKFLESRSGALLDFWGDNLVHVAVFLSMAIGWSKDIGAGWPLWIGGVAIAGTLAAAATLGAHGVADDRGDDNPSWVTRLTRALAHRDFIYLVGLLAAFGKAWWFLFFVASGTPVFVLLCLLARHSQRASLPR
jgi:1L-myo-inositol 1-phosphate cytidylyltransferase / CDP-L-myo-inositol myo-inositolphosphotransferase